MTLLAAPAGSGKTMLLTSWMSATSLPGPVAWLSLDADDNDPARFWTYVLAALCRSGAVPADSGLQTLQPQADDALLPARSARGPYTGWTIQGSAAERPRGEFDECEVAFFIGKNPRSATLLTKPLSSARLHAQAGRPRPATESVRNRRAR